MLNCRSSLDEIFIKIAIWGSNLVFNGAPKFVVVFREMPF